VSSSANISNKAKIHKVTGKRACLGVVYLKFGKLHVPCQFLHCDPEGREPGAKVTHHLSCQGLHGCHVDDLEEGKCESGGRKGDAEGRRQRGESKEVESEERREERREEEEKEKRRKKRREKRRGGRRGGKRGEEEEEEGKEEGGEKEERRG